jgi:Leucine-rich repeat (LRR) protein
MKYIKMNKYNRLIINKKINIIDLKNGVIDTFPSLPDHITEIYLDNNDIPNILCDLPCNLRVLSICSNLVDKILHIPNTLQELYVSYNKNIVLPSTLINTNLLIFYCSGCNLKVIPDLPDTIKSCNVSNNKITDISIPFNIKVLNIANNKLSRLNLTKNHTNLTELRCDNNNITQITCIPDNICELYCSSNKIQTFPDLPINLHYGLKIVENSTTYPYNLKIVFSFWNNPLIYNLTNVDNIGLYINAVNKFRLWYFTNKIIASICNYIKKRRKYVEYEYEFL